MLNTLVFELAVPTPFFFAQRFLLNASENTEELNHLTMFLLELCLLDYKMLKWLPSVTSAAALYLARRMIGLPVWTAELQRATCYGEAFLRACVLEVQSVLTNPDPKEEAVRKKYLSTKFKCVSKIPACTL
jgi:cyclin B